MDIINKKGAILYFFIAITLLICCSSASEVPQARVGDHDQMVEPDGFINIQTALQRIRDLNKKMPPNLLAKVKSIGEKVSGGLEAITTICLKQAECEPPRTYLKSQCQLRCLYEWATTRTTKYKGCKKYCRG
uniref:uncharacterized protein LOC122588897 n=1 Tax=Erigeron canadensis TaxID=72917 RepID=UPI001CB95B69|nr:uncharacterized protein LOC122588897 [Erigeron canadensis]